ncbi:MAG: T9SS type A sorting domain-containing protein [Calditrichaeota bacterium]|nr:T9SS type A sorting domain-containing protein [Calditrichota bacterium]
MRLKIELLLAALLIYPVSQAAAYPDNPPDGVAGNPPARNTCVQCHNTFALNSGQGRLELLNAPERYRSGQRYRITVRLSDPGASRWGFELTSLNSQNARFGALTTVNNITQVSGFGNSPQYLKHNINGTFRGQGGAAQWEFDWTAPNGDNLGPVTFWFAGNAANNNNSTTGDRIYASSASIGQEPPPLDRFATPLAAGWNIMSTICPPPNPDIPTVFREIVNREHLLIVKDQSGRFYVPGLFNSIAGYDVRQGYMVKLSDPDTLLVISDPVPPDHPIPLRQGWNFVAYFPEQQVAAPTAFSNLGENIIFAKDERGNFYNRAQNFSNMGNLRRGKGYQVKMAVADTLVWNFGQGLMAIDDRFPESMEVSAPVQHFPEIAPTGSNMSLLLNVECRVQDVDWEAGVFTEAGLAVGSAVHRHSDDCAENSALGLAVWGDDPTTEAIDGARDGEQLTIRIYDGQMERVVRPIWQEGNGCYSSEACLTGTLEVGREAGFNPTEMTLISAWPNPFNARTRIAYRLDRATPYRLALHDPSGRELQLIEAGTSPAGEHAVEWDGEGLVNGVYFVRLTTAYEAKTMKVFLIK